MAEVSDVALPVSHKPSEREPIETEFTIHCIYHQTPTFISSKEQTWTTWFQDAIAGVRTLDRLTFFVPLLVPFCLWPLLLVGLSFGCRTEVFQTMYSLSTPALPALRSHLWPPYKHYHASLVTTSNQRAGKGDYKTRHGRDKPFRIPFLPVVLRIV